jgi:hypothetical protein
MARMWGKLASPDPSWQADLGHCEKCLDAAVQKMGALFSGCAQNRADCTEDAFQHSTEEAEAQFKRSWDTHGCTALIMTFLLVVVQGRGRCQVPRP